MHRSIILFLAVFTTCFTAPQRRPPPFLEGAPEAIQNEFWDLVVKDEEKPDAEIEADLRAWIDKIGEPYKTKFEGFVATVEKQKERFEKQHEELLSKLSPEAKKADAEITAVVRDKTLNGIKRVRKIKAILNGLPENVRHELLQDQAA
ncbi:hypothetical protein AB6A40_004396 [Gnathostoma spinigerum]|uniref:SXP/RAL-2 family protein Ani s 5-like cation-binding domain-containing protein n=1 Tax=Gnathostoma spinigerum TaxID=75299 RepID=A0ABD6ELU2_9BILA